MKKAWVSLVVSVCIIGGAVTVGFAQEFPEDELVEEQVVVIPFRTGLINKGKVRQIYRHTRKIQTGWVVERKPVYGERQYLYTYLPHPVTIVERVKPGPPEIEKKLVVSPQVGVISSSPSSSSKSKSRSRRSRR
ncbi:MAG: hypothetical protein DFNUSKGM_000345 [Candidatus Fervidibacter sacchari]